MTVSSPSASRATRRTVASYGGYDGAERAVDFLSEEGFPVEHAAIVGTGLRYVEHVVGAIWAPTTHAAMRGRRDFDSVAQTRADRYDVQVDEGFASRAE